MVRVEQHAVAEPLVSIIIATYNWSSVLRLAIQSVLGQTEQSFEILVIGDGCTDDSEAVVRSIGDARIRWHNLPVNSGSQSAPNNAGLQLARGHYVAYLGHDDIWHPAHLRSMVGALESAGADIVSSLLEMIGPKGTNYRVVTGFYEPHNYDPVYGLPPSGLLHRRECAARVGGWPDYRTIVNNPDVEFVSRLHRSGCRIVSTGELTVFKFNSAFRKNSYVEKPSHEQRRCLRSIRWNPFFMPIEARRIVRIHRARLPMHSPDFAAPPGGPTPGWTVTQYRKFRGLE
jgi:glycosyltransferase involved in cell wall biosynthesis